MSRPLPSRAAKRGGASRVARVLGLVLVCLLVAALAAATFVLSYAGMHSFALEAGIQGRFARGYPVLVDAMIVIAGTSVLVLRGARLPSKFLAWLILLIMLGAAAAADAIHASGRKLPGKYASIIAAILPWVLAFIAFILLLVILRYVHLRMVATARDRMDAQEARDSVPDGQLTVRRPGLSGHAPLRPGQSGSFGQGQFGQGPFAQDTGPTTQSGPHQGTGTAPSIVPGFDRSAAGQAGFAHQVLSVPRQANPTSAADADDRDPIAVDKQSAPGAATDDAQATLPEDATGTGSADDADAGAGVAATKDAEFADDDQVDMRFHQMWKPSASEAWTITSDQESMSEATAASDSQAGAGGRAEGEDKSEPGGPANPKDKARPAPQPGQKAESKATAKPKAKTEPSTQADADGPPEPSADS